MGGFLQFPNWFLSHSPKVEEKRHIDDMKKQKGCGKKKVSKQNKGRSSKNASTDKDDKDGAFFMEECENEHFFSLKKTRVEC